MEAEQKVTCPMQTTYFWEFATDSLPAGFTMWMRGKTLLDVGCAWGDACHLFDSRYGMDVTGIDLEPELVASCLINYPDLKWLSGDAFVGIVRDEHDVIYCSNVLEHRTEPFLGVAPLIRKSKAFILVLPYEEGRPLIPGHYSSFSLTVNESHTLIPFLIGKHHLVSSIVKDMNHTGMWGGRQVALLYLERDFLDKNPQIIP